MTPQEALIAYADRLRRESRDAVLDALEAAVKALYAVPNDEDKWQYFGPDEFWVDSEPYVRAAAVLEAIQQQRRQP